MLDNWPPLPLIIHDPYPICPRLGISYTTSSLDNIIAALGHNDRVFRIKLVNLTKSQMGYVTNSAAMQKPFPELTDLQLVIFHYRGLIPILPDSFLGRTAPRLRSLVLDNVPFPGLPKLLPSATHLVELYLDYIPCSGYIPPEVMATSLSALTSLESLRLHFRFPRPRPALESRRPPPPTRSILLNLTKMRFQGASEYLEEILARIDAPRLNKIHITLFNQIIFDTPQLFQFISRRPTLRAPEKGHIAFNSGNVFVGFPSQTSDYAVLSVRILCMASEWQLSSLEQICTSSLPPFSTLEDLYIHKDPYWQPHWQDDVENSLWLDLLHAFVAVKNLYLPVEYAPGIAFALQELVEGGMIEVLPTLENIFLEGFQTSEPLHEGIEKFVAARRLTSHPVAVFRWGEDPSPVMQWKIYNW